MGSANPPIASLSRHFLFQNPTDARPDSPPTSSPVFAGFSYDKDHEGDKSEDEDKSRVDNLGYEDMLARLEEVKNFYTETFPDEMDPGGIRIREMGSSGNLSYLSRPPQIQSSSKTQSPNNEIGSNGVGPMGGYGFREPFPAPQIQSSPRIQSALQDPDSSGVALDRFREGRESLSVIRNVTVRETKRPKTRSQDHDYKRRFSSSSTIPNLVSNHGSGESPVGRNQTQHQSFHGYISPENVHSHHLPCRDPSLRINSGTALEMDQGFANRERRVADCTLPPSSGGIVRDDGVERTQGRYPVSDGHMKPSNDGGGGGYPAGTNRPPVLGGQTPGDGDYLINLTYEGNLVRHQVNQHMMVEQLVRDAADLYQLNAPDMILMLFGMHPQTLSRNNRLSDPPRVGPGATVLVFCIAGHARNMGGRLPPPPLPPPA
jgi:hypothetical protein